MVLQIVRSLVDQSELVTVIVNRDVSPVTLEIRVAPNDIGKVIGKQGRTARSIRTVVSASAQAARQPPVAIDIRTLS